MNSPTELCKIALHHGCLKSNLYKRYNNHIHCHHYTYKYHYLFKHMRNETFNLLEIGIGNPQLNSFNHFYKTNTHKIGANLFMWRDYFKNAHIHGIDINNNYIIQGHKRISCLQSNQVDSKKINKYLINKSFNIIIDDGSSVPYHQIQTCNNLIHKLNKGGFYIIENIYVGNHGSNPLNYIKNSLNIKEYHKIEFYFEPKGYTNSAIIIIHDTRKPL